jgi:TonB family protein
MYERCHTMCPWPRRVRSRTFAPPVVSMPSPWRSSLGIALVAALASSHARAQDAIRAEVTRGEPKLTRPPALRTFAPAPYPAGPQRRGVQGTVELVLDIDARGAVTVVNVLSAPDPELGRAAAAAARQFRFSPAEVDGRPAPVRLRYAYSFVLRTDFRPRLPRWMEERQVAPAGSDLLVGRVREGGTRLPLPGAAVVVRNAGIEIKTDDRGAFGVRQLPPGRYRVEAISLEHERDNVEVTIRAGEQTRIDFYLRPRTENPYETVVRGQRRKTVVSRVTLREKELTTVPGTFGDPIRVIESLPGVARVPYVGGALLIRGAAPNDSGVFLDGTPIPLLYHFLGGPSVLHPEFLDRIDYYPGNPDVRYGRLTAGVIDVNTRNTFTQQWGGALDINLLNTSLLLKMPLHRKVSVTAAARRSYIDAILPPLLRLTDRKATTVVPVYYDYQLRTDVQLGGDDRLFVLFFGSDDRLAIASNEPAEAIKINLDTAITFHRFLAQWRKQITDRLTSRLTPTAGFNWVKMNIGDAKIDLLTINVLLREDLEYRVSRRVTLRFGVDASFEQDRFDTLVPLPLDYRNSGAGEDLGAGNVLPLSSDVHPVKVRLFQFGIGLYGDAIVSLGTLQLVCGVRAELYRYVDLLKLAVDPRVTARLQLVPSTTLKAAAGMFSQQPEPNEVNDTFGNPRLGLKHAAHFSLGVEHRFLPFLVLDAQLYAIRRFEMVLPTTAVRQAADGTLQPLRFGNQGGAYSYGLEVMLKHDVTRRFYGWLAYTLSRSMAQQEPDGPYLPFVFDQTHILTLVASVRLGLGWELGARFRLVSGRPDTPVLGGIFDSDQDLYRRIIGARLDGRLSLFHQLDLRVEKTWLFKLWRLAVYLDVQNVYNATNPEAMLYDYRYQNSGPLRGLPILPSLGIRGTF